ncbi:hypothetical protein BJV78DRAFT_1354886 [Lactifluus subvellereus]|nr:hypothetical protein BJV78DRAFT_1354886 [Lactifluus subvellereus]
MDGKFNYMKFWQKIVELFELDDMWAQETLDWWNMEIFGNKRGNPFLAIADVEEEDDDNNVIVKARAQAAKRKAAACEAATSESGEPESEEDPSVTHHSTPTPTSPMHRTSTPLSMPPGSPLSDFEEELQDAVAGHPPRLQRTRHDEPKDKTILAPRRGPAQGTAASPRTAGKGRAGKGRSSRR